MIFHGRFNSFFHLAIVTVIVLLASCKPEAPSKGKYQYFDLSGFIDDEVKRLSAENPPVEKRVFLNGKDEMQSNKISSWENELSAFKEADINKKSFLGKYAADSSYQGNILRVTYRALDQSLRTKHLSVDYNGSLPAAVRATIATDNTLYSSRQELEYEPGKGYRISGKQSVKFLEPDSFYVEAKFVSF